MNHLEVDNIPVNKDIYKLLKANHKTLKTLKKKIEQAAYKPVIKEPLEEPLK